MNDALAVSLHDHDLREELELTTRLIVALNESGRALSMAEVDDLLGLGAQREPAA